VLGEKLRTRKVSGNKTKSKSNTTTNRDIRYGGGRKGLTLRRKGDSRNLAACYYHKAANPLSLRGKKPKVEEGRKLRASLCLETTIDSKGRRVWLGSNRKWAKKKGEGEDKRGGGKKRGSGESHAGRKRDP